MNKIVALLFTVALMATARAQTPAQFAALQAQVQSLQAQVAALQRSPVQALVPFLTVDPNPKYGVRGPNIVFHDANVHITNGTFATATANGLGNLIIGYNELPNPNIAQPGERGGSHNLVMGRWNKFFDTSFSSFIGGQWNIMRGFESAIVSGYNNNLSGAHNVIVGGSQNGESGLENVVIGGYFNGAGGTRNVTLGGLLNHLAGNYSVLLGGRELNPPVGDYQIFPQ